MFGSLAGTDSGLRGPATGEADGDVDVITDGFGAAEPGLAEALDPTDGLGPVDTTTVVAGLSVAAGAGGLVGAEQPRANSNVAVELRPPVMFKTRRSRSRRDR